MTPNSPEPSMDWRDTNSNKKTLKPLVKVSVPPRMPKKKSKKGFIAFLKSLFTLSIFKTTKKKTNKNKRSRNHKKGNQRVNKNNRNERNQNNRVRKHNKGQNTNQKRSQIKKPSKPVVLAPKEKIHTDSKESKKGKAKSDIADKDGNKASIDSSTPTTPAPTPTPEPAPEPTQAPKPTRALNDPRYKSE